MSLITGLLAKSEAKKTRKAQEAANLRQETQAKEAAALNNTRSDPGADIIFGAAKGDGVTLRRDAKRGSRAASSTSSGSGVGGFGIPSGGFSTNGGRNIIGRWIG